MAIEFALTIPIFFLVLVAIVMFAIVMNHDMMLTDSVRTASRNLSISRGATTTPMTDVMNQIYASAPGLTQTSLSVTLTVNGISCTTDATCLTALAAAQGKPAQVAATYPCNLTMLGINYQVGCTLIAKTTELIQ
ncbi:MAG: TadE/TadG family type IV pilus assembly protein [Hyphomicrobiales bacterium]